MLVMSELVGSLAQPSVWACALALGCRDKEVIVMDRDCAGIPVGRDETEGHLNKNMGSGDSGRIQGGLEQIRQARDVENHNCVQGSIGHK